MITRYDSVDGDTKQEILYMYQHGMGVGSIAEETGLPAKIIARVLLEFDVQVKAQEVGEGFWSDEKISEFIDDYSERKLSIQEMVKKHNLRDVQQLYEILNRYNVPMRSQTKESIQAHTQRFALAVQMYVDGSRIIDIASETGVSNPQLYAELARRGIPTRGNSTSSTSLARQKALNKAVELYEDLDVPIYEVLGQTNLTAPVLYAELRRRGIMRRNERKWAELFGTEPYEEA